MISSILRRPLLRADKGLLGGLQPYLRLRYPHLGGESLQPLICSFCQKVRTYTLDTLPFDYRILWNAGEYHVN